VGFDEIKDEKVQIKRFLSARHCGNWNFSIARPDPRYFGYEPSSNE